MPFGVLDSRMDESIQATLTLSGLRGFKQHFRKFFTMTDSPSGGDVKPSLLSSPLRTGPLAIHPESWLELQRSESKDSIYTQ